MVVVKTFTARHPLFTRPVLCAQANPPSLGLRTSRWSSSYQRLLPMDRMDVYSFQRFTLMTDWSTYDKNTKAKDAAACIESVAFSPTDHDCEHDPHANHQRSVKEASGECQGRVTGKQCVTDGSRVCLAVVISNTEFVLTRLSSAVSSSGRGGTLRRRTTLVSRQCAVPSSRSFSASLPGLRFASAYNPDAQNPDYLRT